MFLGVHWAGRTRGNNRDWCCNWALGLFSKFDYNLFPPTEVNIESSLKWPEHIPWRMIPCSAGPRNHLCLSFHSSLHSVTPCFWVFNLNSLLNDCCSAYRLFRGFSTWWRTNDSIYRLYKNDSAMLSSQSALQFSLTRSLSVLGSTGSWVGPCEEHKQTQLTIKVRVTKMPLHWDRWQEMFIIFFLHF